MAFFIVPQLNSPIMCEIVVMLRRTLRLRYTPRVLPAGVLHSGWQNSLVFIPWVWPTYGDHWSPLLDISFSTLYSFLSSLFSHLWITPNTPNEPKISSWSIWRVSWPDLFRNSPPRASPSILLKVKKSSSSIIKNDDLAEWCVMTAVISHTVRIVISLLLGIRMCIRSCLVYVIYARRTIR